MSNKPAVSSFYDMLHLKFGDELAVTVLTDAGDAGKILKKCPDMLNHSHMFIHSLMVDALGLLVLVVNSGDEKG